MAIVKNMDCWKSCEYASPKVEWIEQHIKDVQNLVKAKKIIKNLMVFAEIDSREYEEAYKEAKQFLKE